MTTVVEAYRLHLPLFLPVRRAHVYFGRSGASPSPLLSYKGGVVHRRYHERFRLNFISLSLSLSPSPSLSFLTLCFESVVTGMVIG